MIVPHQTGSYEIQFCQAKLPQGIVITDENVAAAHPHLLDGHETILLEPGEHTKSLAVHGDLCRQLVLKGASRKSVLIALGGGVIGDLVGFVAATYMRGIQYVQIPTTLLAQVDSSVGGKTGVDLPEGKNLVGAFYPPTSVQIDVSLLESLPDRQFRCGLAEVLKYGFIQSPRLDEDLRSQSLVQGDHRLPAIVEECIGIKAWMVKEDEFETKGVRAQLNFGHTVGHALEQITNYQTFTHGEAIAIGMAVESKIGEEIGFSDAGLTASVESLMETHGLPTNAVELKEIDQLIAAMRKDKKSSAGEISMSLVKRVGECSFVPNIDEAIVKGVLREFAKI